MSQRYRYRNKVFSQYGDDVYRAYFLNGEPSWVHARVLRSYPHLKDRVFENPDEAWPLCVNFKEFDVNIGNAVIHFLYTGTYKCLEAYTPGSAEMNQCGLAECLQIYIAASSLDLCTLRRHAEQEFKTLGDNMSLRSIFDVVEDLKTGLDGIPVIKEYLKNRMEQAKFGAPGATTNSVLRDLASADTLSTLTLKVMASQHQHRMAGEGNENSAAVVDGLASMYNQPDALDSGAKSALQFMECELESLLMKKAETGRRLPKSDRSRMRWLSAEIKKLQDLGHVKNISDIDRGIANSTKRIAQTSRVEVANQDRSEMAKSFAQKLIDTPKNKPKQKSVAGLKPDHTSAVWLGRKGSSNRFYADYLESFEDDMSMVSDSVPWLTPSSLACSRDE